MPSSPFEHFQEKDARFLATDNPALAGRAYWSRAIINRESGDDPSFVSDCHKAMEVGSPHFRLRAALNLSWYYVSQGKNENALRIVDGIHADHYPQDSHFALHDSGMLYKVVGHVQTAFDRFTALTEISDDHISRGFFTPVIFRAIGYYQLGELMVTQDRLEEAETYYQEYLKIYEKHKSTGEHIPMTKEVLMRLSMLADISNQPETAEALLRKAIAYDDDNPAQAGTMLILARKLAERGSTEEAVKLCRQVLTGDGHPSFVNDAKILLDRLL